MADLFCPECRQEMRYIDDYKNFSRFYKCQNCNKLWEVFTGPNKKLKYNDVYKMLRRIRQEKVAE